ncbi:hypothetical protein [Amycolatopsis sp. NPDC003731]
MRFLTNGSRSTSSPWSGLRIRAREQGQRKSNDEGEPANAGSVFAELVKDGAVTEDQRRESIDLRARTTISSSGALVTLMLAFAALVTKVDRYHLPSAARVLIVIASIAFAVSAVAATMTALPQIDRVVDPVRLAQELPSRWDWTEDAARKKVTATRLAQLRATQRANSIRAVMLFMAIAVQVVAVGVLSAAICVVLIKG